MNYIYLITQQNLTTGVDISDFAKKADLASLKSDFDKLDINKLEKVACSLNSLKSEVHELDVEKLKAFPVD